MEWPKHFIWKTMHISNPLPMLSFVLFPVVDMTDMFHILDFLSNKHVASWIRSSIEVESRLPDDYARASLRRMYPMYSSNLDV